MSNDTERTVKLVADPEPAAKETPEEIKKKADEQAAADAKAAEAKAAEEAAKEPDWKKNYDELRKISDRRATENSQLKQELTGVKSTITQLTEAINKMSARKVTPEEWQQKGPEIVEQTVEERVKAVRQEYEARWAKQAEKDREYETKLELASRKSNPAYPDWEKLQPTMQKLAQEATDIDWLNTPTGEIMDELYARAKKEKLPGAQDALRQELEAKIRKELEEEARAASDGTGGKKGVPAGAKKPEDMSLTDLEKHIQQLQAKG